GSSASNHGKPPREGSGRGDPSAHAHGPTAPVKPGIGPSLLKRDAAGSAAPLRYPSGTGDTSKPAEGAAPTAPAALAGRAAGHLTKSAGLDDWAAHEAGSSAHRREPDVP